MPLQNTHRPDSFENFIGNDSVINSLISALDRDDIPRSYLCTGVPGSGKTSIAFILKNEFEIEDIDFYYYNSANTRGIDTVRQIAQDSKLAPMSSTYKMYILDESHQISGAAAEALLLLLENPPTKTIFILCTSEPEKLKLSIKRRCFQCNLQPASDKNIRTALQAILQIEKTAISDTLSKAIVDAAQGSIGMSVAILDAIIDMSDEDQMLDVIASMKGVADTEAIEICRSLMNKNWSIVSQLLINFTGEPESLRYMVLAYFSKVLVSKGTAKDVQALSIIINFSESFMYTKKAGLIAACYISCH